MILRVVKGIGYFSLGFIIGACISASMALTPEQIFEATKPSLIRLWTVAHGPAATGFVVQGKSGKKYIMTNEHVCSIPTGLVAVSYFGPRPTQVVVKNDTSDLCLMTVDPSLVPLKIAEAIDLKKGVHVIGFPGVPGLITPKYVFGFIGATEDVVMPSAPGSITLRVIKSYIADILIIPGNSGSPVLDDQGQVTGVVHGAGRNEGIFVTLDQVKAFLNKH